jgi:hypothetical protein
VEHLEKRRKSRPTLPQADRPYAPVSEVPCALSSPFGSKYHSSQSGGSLCWPLVLEIG